MFQFAFDASLFKLTYETPHIEPLFELPPRSGTRVVSYIPGLQLLRGKYPPLAHFIRNSPSHESGLQDRAAPTFQFAYDASLFKATYETPHSEPSFEVPPRRGTRVPLLLNHNPSQ